VEIERVKDIRLMARAIKEGWPVDRQAVIDALHETIASRDPDLLLGASALLIKCDELNIKREAVYQRELKDNEDRRLQLIELAQRIPITEIGKFLSSDGDGGESCTVEGRTAESAGADGEEAGGG